MVFVCWVLLGTLHMPARHSLGSAVAQSLSLLGIQTFEDQRLRIPNGTQAGSLCCTSSVAERRQGLSRDHTMQPHSKDHTPASFLLTMPPLHSVLLCHLSLCVAPCLLLA